MTRLTIPDVLALIEAQTCGSSPFWNAGTVTVTFTLTTPACPIGPQVAEQMQEFVGEIPGVDEVVPTMVFSPPWTPDKMSEDAKFALGY